MRTSLIICTRNRAEQLRRCLDAVAKIPAGDWELVLVDNGSTDHTAEVIDAAAVNAPIVRVHEPRTGLSRARNAGVRASHGELVAFTDDDCYPTPSYVGDLEAIFTDDTIGAGGGRVLLHDPTDVPVTYQIWQDRVQWTAGHVLPCGAIHGCNMVFRRSALDAIGGFDERIGAGTPWSAGEDVTALAQVAWAGWTVAYDPTPTVFHGHGRKPGGEREIEAGYTRARSAYYALMMRRGPAERRVYAKRFARESIEALVSGPKRIAADLRHITEFMLRSGAG